MNFLFCKEEGKIFCTCECCALFFSCFRYSVFYQNVLSSREISYQNTLKVFIQSSIFFDICIFTSYKRLAKNVNVWREKMPKEHDSSSRRLFWRGKRRKPAPWYKILFNQVDWIKKKTAHNSSDNSWIIPRIKSIIFESADEHHVKNPESTI